MNPKDIPKLRRPTAISLVVIYIVLQIILGIYSRLNMYEYGTGLSPAILWIFVVYGLWTMRKEWMWASLFLLTLSVGGHAFNFITKNALNVFDAFTAIFNIVAIFCLYANKNAFHVSGIMGGWIGTKKEWKLAGILILGLASMAILYSILPPSVSIYALLFMLMLIMAYIKDVLSGKDKK